MIINVAQPFIGPACDNHLARDVTGVLHQRPIIGTANDATGHFNSYRPAIRHGAHGPWTTFATSSVGVTNVFWALEYRPALGGYYMVRVIAFTTAARAQFHHHPRQVHGARHHAATDQPDVTESGRICLRRRAGASCGVAFQWRRNGVNLVNGPRISGVNTDELIIDPTVLADAGQYTSSAARWARSPGHLQRHHPLPFRLQLATASPNSQDFFDFLTAFFGTCP